MQDAIQICHPLSNLDKLTKLLLPHVELSESLLMLLLQTKDILVFPGPAETGTWTACIPIVRSEAVAWLCKSNGFTVRVVPTDAEQVQLLSN